MPGSRLTFADDSIIFFTRARHAVPEGLKRPEGGNSSELPYGKGALKEWYRLEKEKKCEQAANGKRHSPAYHNCMKKKGTQAEPP